MSQSTPGRKRADKYVPFNNDPKGVGTRTNIIMPKDVARTADGFEDPEEFFRSPGSIIDPNRSMMSVMSKAPRTPGSRSVVTGINDTPMTGYTDRTHLTSTTSGPSSNKRGRGRMSDLDMDDDEEEGLAADELLVDEDELGLSPPGAYFPDNNAPSVRLPSRSRLPPQSPSINMDYDNVPSPRRAGHSPRKSTRTTPGMSARLRNSDINSRDEALFTPRGPEDVTADELDESFANEISPEAEADNSALSPTQTSQIQPKKRKSPTRTSPRRAKKDGGNARNANANQEEGEDEDEEGNETERPRKDRYSMASRRSNGTRNGDNLAASDDEASQSDNDNGPSFHYDAGADDDLALGGDVPGDASGFVDDIANGGGDDEDEDDDVDMEEQAMREEEGGGEEQEQEQNEDEEPIVKKRKPKKVISATKKTNNRSVAVNRRPTFREASTAPVPKKTRISQIGLPDEEQENPTTGNFTTRRSHRQHFKPLEYWRNEHFEYKRGPGLPVIKEVVTYPEEKISFAEMKKISRSRSRSRRRVVKDDDDEEEDEDEKGERGGGVAEEDGWDAKTDPTGIVMDFAKGREVHRKVALPKALLEPAMVKGGNFKYQKVFGEGAFMAAGVVYVPIGMAKGAKPSKDNCYVFYVIQGAVQVTIHRTSFVIAPGGQFFVPRANEYSIQNISKDKEAQLFFAQARKIRRDETDGEVGLEDDGVSISNNKKRRSSVATNATGDD